MKKQEKNGKRSASMADAADRHELYEVAVQNVAEECSLVDYLYRRIRGRTARGLREDFCGTASAACEWVTLGRSRFAFGVDNDPEVLRWGRQNRVRTLKKHQRNRVALIRGDVLETATPPVDVAVAFNFSYWVFRRREELLRYFRNVYRSLEPDGIFFLDAFGGSGAFVNGRERTEFDGFTYVWRQTDYRPVTGLMRTRIDFEFPDGSRLKRAFSYEWRVWTLPEIRDLLAEAGFVDTTAWFEIRDENGEGLGEWLPDPHGPQDPVWVANLTATKAG